MNIPNILTLFRIALIPVIAVVFYLPWQHAHLASAIIFMVAAGTDWLDGYLARKLDQSTPLGAFLDPVADKLMVAIALVLLTEEQTTFWFTLPAMIIIGREIVISALREWMAELGERASVAVSYIGKVKTAMQMFSITVLLAFGSVDNDFLLGVGYCALYLAAALTLWSMVQYLKAAMPSLRKS
ncbi:CDP-diacylglycerol--glycerol-3-phosphate 3-phosphatidyltransferase [Sinobacterium norvegicum]|uniref:CDP-diacylglycerol--glycerol-3-phosphate 3-phosphatidyltransferase n=1 Tax=Sinobacterium norvegicum TaxID=1641715 RepID=A0ABM9AA62_9GAMM|nr:CDP-diacylglycerol--glycerol-3-phosphate 3-phosphatidyltransferase [Sinobacterium norvegicum]CAH0990010.1 CDP-diacylglycerol--glycerol-3-phosphate 3-phosphatidyltransferase [Sinobacterium norvegicum]